MGQSMMVSIKMGKSMEKDPIYGVMALNMMGSGLIIKSTDMESTLGWMEELMKDLGKITTCTDKVYILGVMEENMMESITWIKNMGMESIIGLMGGGMKGTGQMGSNMEKVGISYRMEQQK